MMAEERTVVHHTLVSVPVEPASRTVVVFAPPSRRAETHTKV